MKLSRRPATAGDTPWALALHHRAYRDVVERQFGEWDESVQDRFFMNDWSSGGTGAYEILLWDGEPCGYHSHRELEDRIEVGELVVDPAFQGKGIGSQVLRELLRRAAARRIVVKIGALHQNRALELYRRLGFKDTGKTETHTCLEWRPGQRQ